MYGELFEKEGCMDNFLTDIYWYCTDFCVNAANLLGISYIEFNTLIFIILMPLVIAMLGIVNLYRYLVIPIVGYLKKQYK